MTKSPTNTPLDKLLDGGIEKGVVTNIYGPAGSGKSNIAICSALCCVNDGRKVVYIDTEGSFSLDRFKQLGGSEKELKNVILIELHEWEEQHERIKNIENEIDGKVGLVIVDSFVSLYRLALDENNFPSVNKQLATQYSILSKIARKNKIPVLVTNQVYSSKDDKIEMTSRQIAKYWSKALIELKKTEKSNHRIAIVRKHRSIPEGKNIEFEIKESGLKEVGRLSFL
ncbi:MAG TPA: DNA repair and recombination protein RadB [archaeon]|nr:DNA repair and recombination protein RadB [archaeon]